MLRTSWMAVLGLALALVATVRAEEYRVDKERGRVTALALQAANVTAERDSTRDVAMTERKVAEVLSDSLRLAERMVVQAAQHADALDRALGQERRAKYEYAATLDSLARVVAIDVALDSIPGDLRLGCGAPDRDGIRPATVDAITPRWATVRLHRLEQVPALCASPGLTSMATRTERQFAFTPLTAGFGRALSLDGRWSWALFLGGGFSSW